MSGFLSSQPVSESTKPPRYLGVTKAIKYIEEENVLHIEPIKLGEDIIKIVNVTDDFKNENDLENINGTLVFVEYDSNNKISKTLK